MTPVTFKANRWFKAVGGDVRIMFGKHNGKLVSELLRTAPDYLGWMIGTKGRPPGVEELPADVADFIKVALGGPFAAPVPGLCACGHKANAHFPRCNQCTCTGYEVPVTDADQEEHGRLEALKTKARSLAEESKRVAAVKSKEEKKSLEAAAFKDMMAKRKAESDW